MNRTLMSGIAMFIAVVGIALLGGEKQAVAGHGCDGARKCCGPRVQRCGGRERRERCCGRERRERCSGRRDRCSGRQQCCHRSRCNRCGCPGAGHGEEVDEPAAPEAPEKEAMLFRGGLFSRVAFIR